ncbi:predicted protein [Naegleria gruberi]|uniref:Predicted protein n=1 Tax=Naegleria gruberi TaxID=5762 RepID=D2VD33_NAEGR|nr:uncharacterized protein NAEGRDRAFT_38945 [Naegleria gruberi]EFC45258.1 predicted protein [Naegleria gruberi]|eukprot:XP_002678002.1 predicted protein [Naegleria gruberi strain NEG-M]
MCFKFSYETLSGAIGLTILNRLDGNALGATTILSLLTISFGLAQSISSSTVEGLLKIIRATRLYCLSLVFFALLVVVMIILEASTGGTLTTAGWWTPWIIFPIYIFIGFSVGVMEVLRKIIPASILGNNESSVLKRINAGVHITYELAGTVGAFLSSVFIEKMGTIFALFHIPVFFIAASIFLFFITVKEVEIFEDSETKEQVNVPSTESAPTTSAQETTPQPNNKVLRILKKIGTVIKNYFKSMYIGAKLVLTNRYYIWLIPCFVIPQVLHRLIENIFLPAYSKNILKKGSYSGILLGGSNFGELCGAGMLLIFAKKVKLPTVWIVLDCLFLNLMWIFPFLTFNEKTDDNLIFAICMVPAMMLISGSWAAGDISQVAYLQSTLSEEPNEKTGVNELAAVMSFLYSCYIILTTLIAFGLSQAIDRFKENGQPEFGFMTICIFMSVVSLVICVIYLVVAKFKPSLHEQKEALKSQKEETLPEATSAVKSEEETQQVSVSV